MADRAVAVKVVPQLAGFTFSWGNSNRRCVPNGEPFAFVKERPKWRGIVGIGATCSFAYGRRQSGVGRGVHRT